MHYPPHPPPPFLTAYPRSLLITKGGISAKQGSSVRGHHGDVGPSPPLRLPFCEPERGVFSPKTRKKNRDFQLKIPASVSRSGLEPETHTLKVYCSTN